MICFAQLLIFCVRPYSQSFPIKLAFKNPFPSRLFLSQTQWIWCMLKLTLVFCAFICVSSGSTCWFGDAAETRQREPTGAAVQTTLCLAVVRITYTDILRSVYLHTQTHTCKTSLLIKWVWQHVIKGTIT